MTLTRPGIVFDKMQDSFTLIYPGETPSLNEHRKGRRISENFQHLSRSIKLKLEPSIKPENNWTE